jgi:hypothetical protein
MVSADERAAADELHRWVAATDTGGFSRRLGGVVQVV